jgi:hypothetical protein
VPVIGKERIMIYGPKDDGSYVVLPNGDMLSISVPRSEAHVIRLSRSGCPTDYSCLIERR